MRPGAANPPEGKGSHVAIFRGSVAAQCGIARAIHRLPFNTELAAGALAPERFRFYILQDAIYLGEYARVLALAAAKAPEAATVQVFAGRRWAGDRGRAGIARPLPAEFGVDAAAVCAAEPAPDCLAYTSFLMATAHQHPWPVLVAALVAVLLDLLGRGAGNRPRRGAGQPYRAWIDTYADPHFGEAVARVIGVADQAAATTARPHVDWAMLAAFRRSAQYEWLFWDGAYHRRGWPALG